LITWVIPLQLVGLDVISILAVIGVGYYAGKMFFHMRRGRLERGWLPMLYGASMIAVGYAFLTLEDFFLAYSFYYETVDYIGTAITAAGLIVVMFGFRAHYKAWSLGRRVETGAIPSIRDESGEQSDELDLK
jgi:hypothetical protein